MKSTLFYSFLPLASVRNLPSADQKKIGLIVTTEISALTLLGLEMCEILRKKRSGCRLAAQNAAKTPQSARPDHSFSQLTIEMPA
jgi:hypothetical protein